MENECLPCLQADAWDTCAGYVKALSKPETKPRFPCPASLPVAEHLAKPLEERTFSQAQNEVA